MYLISIKVNIFRKRKENNEKKEKSHLKWKEKQSEVRAFVRQKGLKNKMNIFIDI